MTDLKKDLIENPEVLFLSEHSGSIEEAKKSVATKNLYNASFVIIQINSLGKVRYHISKNRHGREFFLLKQREFEYILSNYLKVSL